MKNIKTLTIGISAHNEEKNISSLLESIFAQKQRNYVLENIYVVCDGCTDNTESVVRNYIPTHKELILINDQKRLGKSNRLNTYYQQNRSDIILILDADVVLANKTVIEEMVKPFYNEKVGLVGGFNVPMYPRNHFESVITTWISIWMEIRKKHNKGLSVHNNLGCITALSKELANKTRIPGKYIPDDDFTYFTALENNFEFRFAKKAVVLYRTVDNSKDFFRQHSRLIDSKKFIFDCFGNWTKVYYEIPKSLKVQEFAKSLLKYPIKTIEAVALQWLLRYGFFLPKEKYINGHWEIAKSSKSTN